MVSLPNRDALITRAKTIASVAKESHAARALKRFGEKSGNVLAGGIAYFSLTSMAAGVVIAATISSYVISRNPDLQEAVNKFLGEAVPGLVGSNGDALLDQSTIRATPITNVVGLVALIVLFFTATRYIGGLRQGMRTMLGREASGALKGKARDFLALAVIAVLVIAGVALQVVASQATDAIAGWLSDDPVSTWVLRGPALGVTLIVDMVFVWMALHVLGRSRTAWSYLWKVLLVTAAAIGVLRLASSAVIGGAASNPVLAPFAAVITVLIFADFVARILLLSAAWLGTRKT